MGNDFVVKWITIPLENGGEAVVVEKKIFDELLLRAGVAFHTASPQPSLDAALVELANQGVSH